MSADTRDLITWSILTLIGVCTLVGFATKFVLLPWLRDHLVTPMQTVERQVSENSHANKPPTVLDRIDDVQQSVNDLGNWITESRQDRKALHDELGRLQHRLDTHLGWSHEEANRLWKRITDEREGT